MSESSDSEAEANGLYTKLLSFKFVMNLHIVEKVLEVTNSLSDQLQAKELLLSKACCLIQSTVEELQVLTKDDAFSALFDKAKVFSAAYEIDATMELEDSNESSQVRKPKRIQKISSNLKSFLGDSTVGKRATNTSLTPKAEIKRIYFDIVDRFLSELDNCFTQNMPLISAMNALHCNSSDFLVCEKLSSILQFYKDVYINEILLTSQICC